MAGRVTVIPSDLAEAQRRRRVVEGSFEVDVDGISMDVANVIGVSFKRFLALRGSE